MGEKFVIRGLVQPRLKEAPQAWKESDVQLWNAGNRVTN